MAYIVSISPSEFEIRWEYFAESKQPDSQRDYNHRGVTKLRFQTKDYIVESELKGDYYTQIGRDTNGTIILKRGC